MSTLNIELILKVDDSIPNWIDRFLEKKFFGKCPAHDPQRNYLNRYCITCDAVSCKYCVASGCHKDHELLTIYRHLYQDVVLLSEIENHIDCTQIQHYKCNKKLVVSLSPLPHTGSGALIVGNGACYICKRKLFEPERFCFCSISCKVQELVQEVNVEVDQTSEPEGRKRSRKGVPHKASIPDQEK